MQPPLHPLPSLLGSSRAVMWVLPRPGGSLPAAPPGLWVQQQGGIASPGSWRGAGVGAGCESSRGLRGGVWKQ